MLIKILLINFWKKNVSEGNLGKIDKKIVTFCRFWPLRNWNCGRGGEPVKKGKFGIKIFSNNVEWNSRKL